MSTPFKMKGWSPFTQKTHPKHPITPPTEEQSKKSKGTFNPSNLIAHGTWDRPGVKASFKKEWGNIGDIISKKIKKYTKGKSK